MAQVKIDEWNAFYEELDKKLSVSNLNRFLLKTAGFLNASIKMRVQKDGVGSDGKLPPYSPRYSRYKKNTGRNGNFRDLTYTGRMFQSLSETLIAPLAVKQYFMGIEAVKAESNEERTPFFSHTESEEKILEKEIENYFGFMG